MLYPKVTELVRAGNHRIEGSSDAVVATTRQTTIGTGPRLRTTRATRVRNIALASVDGDRSAH